MIKNKLTILKNNKFFFTFLLLSAAILFFLFFPFHQNQRNTSSSGVYRIGLITDVHSQRSPKNSYDVFPHIRKFFGDFSFEMNNVFHPDIVAENGDLIEGTGREGQKSIDDFLKAEEYFNKVKAPKFYVLGNHETEGLSKEDWQKITNNESTYYNIDIGKMRIIVLDANEKKEQGETDRRYRYFSDKQLGWLEELLRNSGDFPYKIVFSHYPLLGDQENHAKTIYPEDLARINELFTNYKVNAVFAGHTEQLRLEEIDGTKYFTLPGVDKSKTMQIRWLSCFYEIYVGEEVKVEMFYKKDSNQEKYEKLIIPSEEFDKIEK